MRYRASLSCRPLFSLVLVAACGGEAADNTPVPDLSTSSQVSLCERFVAEICTDPDFADFCDRPCEPTACAAAVENGHVDTQCGNATAQGGPATAQMVEDCASTGDVAVCVAGGGCMFDALEAACP